MLPSVITFMVSPISLSTISEVRIERGIEIQTIKVLRQLPRKRRIMMPVRIAAMIASRTTPRMDARTKRDWSKRGFTFNSGVRPARILGRMALTLFTTERVDACPFLRTVSNAPRLPLVRTMFV